VPISAKIAHAAVMLMPGISASRRIAAVNGAAICSIVVSRVARSVSIASTRASILASRNAWWPVK
jgi:hypothetical protein